MSRAELQVTSHFSFLRGVSSPKELFATAALMGMPALGVCDRNSVAGIVRSMVASEQIRRPDNGGHAIRLVVGCRLDLVTGHSLLVWPEDVAAWSRLVALLTVGKKRADPKKGEKGRCFLHWDDVAAQAAGLVGALVSGPDGADPAALRWMAEIFPDRGHVCLTYQRRPGDRARLHALAIQARAYGLCPLATGDVLYHHPDRRMLQDVVTAIREKTTIDALGLLRERSADRCLQPPDEMERRFADWPDALAAVDAIVERCRFSPRELAYQYPDEVVMSGRSPQEALERLTRSALDGMFAGTPPEEYAKLLRHELGLVQQMEYAPYFLTVNSIVGYARSQGILCQGRGSAANSMICYVLGITSIDPIEHSLLFERFISTDRREPPDIDVDFEHERREEVIQWIYQTYGHEHAALTAVVSRFRARGAVREVGKALGLPEDLTGALAGQVWGWSAEGVADRHVDALGLDRSDPRLALTLDLARELIGTPRHLSQHPGGFVLARERLDDAGARRAGGDGEALGDRVGEGGHRGAEVHEGRHSRPRHARLHAPRVRPAGRTQGNAPRPRLARAADGRHRHLRDDPEGGHAGRVPDREPRADEHAAAHAAAEFYDLAIQVAIVRPGPIQGDMVHPYLKRRDQLRRNRAWSSTIPARR